MNQKIKKQWVRELRSGKYKQGRGALCTFRGKTKRYCCLGVLCELAVKAKVIPPEEELLYDYEDAVLPHKVAVWAGLWSGSPHTEEGPLDILNDEGKRFTTIARIIEDTPDDWTGENIYGQR